MCQIAPRPSPAWLTLLEPDRGGAVCGNCAHRGYSRQSSRGYYDPKTNQDVYRNYRTLACAMFKALTGKHGPAVEADCRACKYFEQKPPA